MTEFEKLNQKCPESINKVAVYSFGKIDDDPIYTNPKNYGLHNKKEFVTNMAVKDRIPMFSWELKPYLIFNAAKNEMTVKKGQRHFTFMSYRAMFMLIKSVAPDQRHYYERVHNGWPCNFFVDLDFELKHVKSGSIDLEKVQDFLWHCCKLVLEDLRINKIEGFNFDVGKIWWSVLYGNRPGKQSRHLLMHLPENKMFRNYEDCYIFYNLVIEKSKKIFPNIEDNILFYLDADTTDEYKVWNCIVDNSVYSKDRDMRMIGNVKNQLDGVEKNGYLYPKCRHDENISCVDAKCSYRVNHNFSASEFLENMICFLPRGENGKPIEPELLKLNIVSTTLEKIFQDYNIKKIKRSNNNEDDPISNFKRTKVNEKKIQQENEVSETFKNIQREDIFGRKKKIFYEISKLIQKQLGVYCEVSRGGKFDSDPVTAFISTHCSVCPYILKLKNEIKHKSNHIGLIVSLDFPLPLIKITCTDELCSVYLKKADANGRKEKMENLEIKKPELWQDIMNEVFNFYCDLNANDNDFNLTESEKKQQ